MPVPARAAPLAPLLFIALMHCAGESEARQDSLAAALVTQIAIALRVPPGCAMRQPGDYLPISISLISLRNMLLTRVEKSIPLALARSASRACTSVSR